jgi:hypothetical protein
MDYILQGVWCPFYVSENLPNLQIIRPELVEALRVGESSSLLPACSRNVANAASESRSFGCILTELSSVSIAAFV